MVIKHDFDNGDTWYIGISKVEAAKIISEYLNAKNWLSVSWTKIDIKDTEDEV